MKPGGLSDSCAEPLFGLWVRGLALSRLGRNQEAIEALEQGDDSVITRLMEVLKRPYDEQPEHDELADRRPEWARHKAGCSALSCSS